MGLFDSISDFMNDIPEMPLVGSIHHALGGISNAVIQELGMHSQTNHSPPASVSHVISKPKIPVNAEKERIENSIHATQQVHTTNIQPLQTVTQAHSFFQQMTGFLKLSQVTTQC